MGCFQSPFRRWERHYRGQLLYPYERSLCGLLGNLILLKNPDSFRSYRPIYRRMRQTSHRHLPMKRLSAHCVQ